MATIVEDFAPTAIKNASVQFKESDGTVQPGTKFGCVGSMEGETTLKELIKRCEGVEVGKKIKPEKIDLTISGHIPIAVVRNFFGINTDNLKPGIYKYSTQSKAKEFIFTADVIDEFEDVVKLIAFPKAVSAIGFKFAVENGADEVAEMEVEITAYPDENGNLYYEALVAELTDTTVADTWHTQFNYALVEAVPTP
ncbi:phage tail protein [Metabacillus halosaccharovorans]|uniref:Phage tail protein n=1 Tax=Metabacillus halosaccharovorans TaxID=930124 RepID=A0ABT3DH39_9BACI|nr:phage tail protein [Metabacillus halosaccharovorans]MCV9886239.1 phage tail protein [Metabacillus halosaccharovorans]